MRILDVYGKATGQLINSDKSSVFFSKNGTEDQKKQLLGNMRGMKEARQSKYLGLPLVIGRSKNQVFGFIEDRVNHRLKEWKEKLLTNAGKEVLLKSVVQAIPAYAMSCCRLPKTLCMKICKEMGNF